MWSNSGLRKKKNLKDVGALHLRIGQGHFSNTADQQKNMNFPFNNLECRHMLEIRVSHTSQLNLLCDIH